MIIKSDKPVLSVDSPSSWDVDAGPPKQGEIGSDFMPDYLISLTAPKPSVQHFTGKKHFVGGRFLGEDVASRYGLEIPNYKGVDQIAELPITGNVEKL